MFQRFFANALWLVLAIAPATAADIDLGQATRTYKQFCSHCHGINMVNPGTSSYDLRKWSVAKKKEFYDVVKNGKGDMPAWGDILTEDELAQLWFYVATRAGKEPFPKDTSSATPEITVPETRAAELATLKSGTLTVCMARNGGVMSAKRADGGKGLDYDLSAELARRLGLKLDVTWFESEQEEESDPVKETYAMLAHGLCDLVPGFSLYETALQRADGERAALPRWDDQPDYRPPGFQIDLKPIAVSKPYARIEMGIVVREEVSKRRFDNLANLEGLKVGVEQGTLAGVLTLRQGTAKLVADAVTLNPGPTFLWEMEKGAFEATLVTATAYDFHKRQNPITKLVLTDYRHPIGFNIAFAALRDNAPLIERLNAQIEPMVANWYIGEIARKNNMHIAPPTKPDVMGRLTMADILSRR